MKTLFLGLALVLGPLAVAQTTSERLPSIEEQDAASSAAPSPSVTQSLSTIRSEQASRFGASLLLQSWVGVGDLKENGQGALIDSENRVGLSYKISDKMTTELQHGFELRAAGDKSRIRGLNDQQEDVYKTLDPSLHLNYSSDWRLFGSHPVTIASRYYIPVTQDSVDQTSLGVLRSQTSLDWDLNPRVTLSAIAQGRLYMYRDDTSQEGTGGDSILYLQTGMSATYNVNDRLNFYYLPYLLTKGTGFQRGDFRSDLMNSIWHELGLNLTWGPVTINPAYATYASALNQAGYSGAGSDENSEYDLNIAASF